MRSNSRDVPDLARLNRRLHLAACLFYVAAASLIFAFSDAVMWLLAGGAGICHACLYRQLYVRHDQREELPS